MRTKLPIGAFSPLDLQKEEKLHQAISAGAITLENVLRKWMTEPGILLLDEGPGISEGHMAEKMTIVNSKNESVTIFVDPTTHLPLEKRFSTRDPRYRDRDEESNDLWRLERIPGSQYSAHDGNQEEWRNDFTADYFEYHLQHPSC